jgi:hypothetical protein
MQINSNPIDHLSTSWNNVASCQKDSTHNQQLFQGAFTPSQTPLASLAKRSGLLINTGLNMVCSIAQKHFGSWITPQASVTNVANHPSNHLAQATRRLLVEKEYVFIDKLDSSASRPKIRHFPPLSIVDTIILEEEVLSPHGKARVFEDEDILSYKEIIHTEELASDFFVTYTEHGKSILQQQSTRGCTAAATAMLINDHHKPIDMDELIMRNLGNESDMAQDIRKAGLTPLINYLSESLGLEELRAFILKSGSAIVGINGNEFGEHVVVVDEISANLDQVRLRDPYHGWEITVKGEAFAAHLSDKHVIQIQ